MTQRWSPCPPGRRATMAIYANQLAHIREVLDLTTFSATKALCESDPVDLAVLDWPQEAAQHYAEIRLDMKKRGTQLGAADLMLAAHARATGATVVTNNIKDFGHVKGLRIENWTQ